MRLAKVAFLFSLQTQFIKTNVTEVLQTIIDLQGD